MVQPLWKGILRCLKRRLTVQSSNAIPQYFPKEAHDIGLVIVSYGCCNEWPQTRGLLQQACTLSQRGG